MNQDNTLLKANTGYNPFHHKVVLWPSDTGHPASVEKEKKTALQNKWFTVAHVTNSYFGEITTFSVELRAQHTGCSLYNVHPTFVWYGKVVLEQSCFRKKVSTHQMLK